MKCSSQLLMLSMGLTVPWVLSWEITYITDPEPYGYLKEYLDEPNATASVYIPGRNVSQDFPGSEIEDKSPWSMYINVVGNITNPENNTESISIAQFGFKATRPVDVLDFTAANGTYIADDSWAICGVSIPLDTPDDLTPDDDVDVSCDNVLSEECLRWLGDFANKGTFCQGQNKDEAWEKGPCQSVDGSDAAANIAPAFARKLNGLPSNASSTLLLFSDEAANADLSFYDEYGSGIRLYMVGWGRSDKVDDAGLRIEASDETVPSVFGCMRPTEFAEGSRNLTVIEEESLAMGLGATSVWVMTIISAIVAVTTWL